MMKNIIKSSVNYNGNDENFNLTNSYFKRNTAEYKRVQRFTKLNVVYIYVYTFIYSVINNIYFT